MASCVVLGVLVFALGGASTAWAAAVTERVSISSQGTQGHRPSSVVAITPDGRYVLFDSDAGDLVSPDHNRCTDVFLRDRVRKKTVRVSVRSDGRGVSGCSYGGAVTPDGRYVVFASDATNVVPGPDTNEHGDDVYVRDRRLARTTRVSIGTNGRQFDESGVSNVGANNQMQISDDGRFVSFSVHPGIGSHFHAYVRDRARRVTIRLLHRRINALPVGMSPGGQYIAVAVGGRFDQANGLILRDIAHSSSTIISALLPSYAQPYYGPAFVTAHGRHVAFTTGRHGYVYSRRTNRVAVVPTSNSRHVGAEVNGLTSDGRYVSLVVATPTLLGIYRYDMTGATPPIRADILSTGVPSGGTWVLGAAMNGDGSVVGFSTTSPGVPTDTNQRRDAYIRAGLP